jgi:CRISPR-associated protein Csm4
MQQYRVIYHLRSAVASQWQSDTIFGHLCWALRYLDGENALDHFLDGYRMGDPPIILSNGFPGDLLPHPVSISPLRIEAASLSNQIKVFAEMKDTRRINFLSLNEFNRVINGMQVLPTMANAMPKTHVTLKNQINRLTGSTSGEGGNVFEFEQTFWAEDKGSFIEHIPVSIYLKIRDGFEKKAERLFEFIARQGYGKRKSVGYGGIQSMEFGKFDGFESPPDPNAFVTLSNFTPAMKDPTRGFWRLITKYGKLGEEYANTENPFKRPLLMFSAGSVFYDKNPGDCYGRLVEEVSPVSGVVQYAFAYAVPMVARNNK